MFISKKDLLKRIQRLEEDVKKLATSDKELTVRVGERDYDPQKDPYFWKQVPLGLQFSSKVPIYKPIDGVIQEILKRLNIEMTYSAEKYEWRKKPSLEAKKKGD